VCPKKVTRKKFRGEPSYTAKKKVSAQDGKIRRTAPRKKNQTRTGSFDVKRRYPSIRSNGEGEGIQKRKEERRSHWNPQKRSAKLKKHDGKGTLKKKEKEYRVSIAIYQQLAGDGP